MVAVLKTHPLLSLLRHFSNSDVAANCGLQIIDRAKKRATGHTRRPFIDVKRVVVSGGKGGDGCISFERLFCNPDAGPGGGNGGNGGHVIFQANSDISDFSCVPTICKAADGARGAGSHCHGANAKHTIFKVPLETHVHLLSHQFENSIETSNVGISAHRLDKSTLVATLSNENEQFIAGRGGAGGHGNAFFAASNNLRLDDSQRRLARDGSMRLAERGASGEQRTLMLRLPHFADIGLVGAPNSGKSTLLRRLTRSRPRVAPHPFTTLKPHVGTLLISTDPAELDGRNFEDVKKLFIADLPGLIEGAATESRGLGAEFLSLVEGCSILVYLVDVGSVLSEQATKSVSGSTVIDTKTFETSATLFRNEISMLHQELTLFNPSLVDSSRKFLVIGTKIDLLLAPKDAALDGSSFSSSTNEQAKQKISECLTTAVNATGIHKVGNDCDILLISALRGDNIDVLVNSLRELGALSSK